MNGTSRFDARIGHSPVHADDALDNLIICHIAFAVYRHQTAERQPVHALIHDLPEAFGEKVMNQAERIPDAVSDADRAGRMDLRDVQMVIRQLSASLSTP